jgi:hypothetical protein
MKEVRATLVNAEAKDARGHGSDRRGGDQSTAHKGYSIKHNMMRDEFNVSKGGFHISTHKTLDDAKDTIDRHLAPLDRLAPGHEDEQYSFAGRASGMRPGADVYEGEGGEHDRGDSPGMWTVGNRTDPMPAQQAVRAVLVDETPGDEAMAGSGSAQLMRNKEYGVIYPDRHPDAKHPADDRITDGMGNHVHPSGDGGRVAQNSDESDVSRGASGEISDLLASEDERAVHHDKGLAGQAPKHGDELPENPAEPSDEEPGSGRSDAEPVQAEWYRGGDEPESPHADDEKAHDVPTDSFVDDIRRKLSIKRVMPGGAGQDMKDQPAGQKADEQEDPEDSVDKDQRGVPVPQEPVWSKEEVNYRYASDPQRSCGDCRFFTEPAGCRLVMGMILKTDTCDRFEPEQKDDSSEVRASIATESLREAWTDEARAASAAARQHGYKVKNQDGYGQKLQHADGHQLEIRRDGNWTHREMSPAGAFVGRASGVSSENLENRLRDLHGPVGQKTGGSLYVTDKGGRSTGSLKRQYADQDRRAGVVGKRRDQGVRMSEAWSDEARAAALLARKHGYVKTQKDPMMSRAGSYFKHPDGHDLRIFGDASFSVRPSLMPGKTRTGAGAKSYMSGTGPKDLQKIIDAVHVKRPMSEAWSDAARQASIAARRHGYEQTQKWGDSGARDAGRVYTHPKTGRTIKVDGESGDWNHSGSDGQEIGKGRGGPGPQSLSVHLMDQARGKSGPVEGRGSVYPSVGTSAKMGGPVPADHDPLTGERRIGRESQSGGRGKVGAGTTLLGNQRQVPQTGKRVPALGFAREKDAADSGPARKWGMAPGGTGYQGMREYSPDQPRDKGRFTKGSGSKDGKQEPKPTPKRIGDGPQLGPGRTGQQGRGVSQDEGRSIFQKAGAARGYKENAMREVGWTDEARAAALAARKAGFKQTNKDAHSAGLARNAVMKHPDGHKLIVHPGGNWRHVPGGEQPGPDTAGQNSKDLGKFLKGAFNDPAGSPTSDEPRPLRHPSAGALGYPTGKSGFIKSDRGAREANMKEAGKLPFFARHKNGEAIGLSRLLDIKKGMEAIGYESPLGEVTPPGWEGTVKAMKKSKGVDNPWALAWYMKGKGYTPHKEMDDPSAALGADQDDKTERNKQLDKGRGVMLPGKQSPTKLHPSDQNVKGRWNKQDSRTQPHGDPRMKQQPADHADQDDLIEKRRRKESDVRKRLARRLMRENDYTAMRRVDNASRGKQRRPVREGDMRSPGRKPFREGRRG